MCLNTYILICIKIFSNFSEAAQDYKQWIISLSDSACLHAADPGSILGSRRSPGEGNGNPLQCSCLENPMDRGTW